MHKIIFYLDEKGKSDIDEYMSLLELKNDKRSNIRYMDLKLQIVPIKKDEK